MIKKPNYAQLFLVLSGFREAKKGLLQDMDNANKWKKENNPRKGNKKMKIKNH